MTPQQEKAKELFNKFACEKTAEGYKMLQTINESKRCALIAVDEILDVCKTYLSPYYLEVKKEIEKL